MSTYGWTRSSFCGNGGCVEAAWVSSSRCAAGDCVQVFHDESGDVLVRDSKLGDRSLIQDWTMEEWQELLRAIRVAEHSLDVQHEAVEVVSTWVDTVVLLGLERHQVLRFDYTEWAAFFRGARNGEFTPEVLAAASQDQPAAQSAEATDTAVSVAAGAVNANTAPAPNFRSDLERAQTWMQDAIKLYEAGDLLGAQKLILAALSSPRAQQ